MLLSDQVGFSPDPGVQDAIYLRCYPAGDRQGSRRRHAGKPDATCLGSEVVKAKMGRVDARQATAVRKAPIGSVQVARDVPETMMVQNSADRLFAIRESQMGRHVVTDPGLRVMGGIQAGASLVRLKGP